MIIELKMHSHHQDNTHAFIAKTLLKDYALFMSTRGMSFVLFFATFIQYQRTSIENLKVSADFSIILGIQNVMRELMSPVTNDIKDAVMAVNRNEVGARERLIELYRVSIFSGINPTLAAVLANQIFVLLLPLLGRDNSQLIYLPTLFLPTTSLMMVLTAKFGYGTMRGDIVSSLLLLSSTAVIYAGTAYGFSFITTDASYLSAASFVQCASYVIADSVYLGWKYPTEKLTQSLFKLKEWKRAYLEGSYYNRLGIQPALILSADVLGSMLTTQFLADQGLKAFQPLTSVLGIANGMAATMRPRTQALSRHLLNSLKDDPAQMRSALRKLLLHSALIGMILPIITASLAWFFLNEFINALYNPTPEKVNIVAEGKLNWLAPFIIFAERMLAVGPGGMIFATRSSKDAYDQRLNQYLTYSGAATPILSACLGKALDAAFDLSSSGFWIAMIALNALITILQYGLALGFINHEYDKRMAEKTGEPIQVRGCWTSMWGAPAQYVPLQVMNITNTSQIA